MSSIQELFLQKNREFISSKNHRNHKLSNLTYWLHLRKLRMFNSDNYLQILKISVFLTPQWMFFLSVSQNRDECKIGQANFSRFFLENDQARL